MASNKKLEKNPEVLPVFTKAQIAKHNTREDAWVSCNGFVLDVTEFMADHPGGASVVEQCLGRDILEDMENTDHSPYSYTLMKEYAIGRVEGEEPREMFPVSAEDMRGYSVSEIRNCVDMKKPVLMQVLRAGDKYWPWIVNRPVVHRMEMFETPLLELSSRWPWFYIWFLWPPVSIWGLYCSFTAGFSLGTILMFFVFGVFVWTLCEYALHRFIFHHPSYNAVGNFIHFFAHGVHHLTPTDSSRLTFPPPFSIAIAFAVNFLFDTLMPEGTPAKAAFAGFAIGYLLYDTAHFHLHRSDINNRYFHWAKKAHLNHHYKNEYENFGVSSPFWDYVFGTYDGATQKKKEEEKKRA